IFHFRICKKLPWISTDRKSGGVTMTVRKSLYLDTNGFIYAYFFVKRPETGEEIRKLEYYRKGESVLRALDVCRENNIRVFTTDLTFLEMVHNYYEWTK